MKKEHKILKVINRALNLNYWEEEKRSANDRDWKRKHNKSKYLSNSSHQNHFKKGKEY